MERIQPLSDVRLDDREVVFRRAVLLTDPESQAWEVVLYETLPLGAQLESLQGELELSGITAGGSRFAGRVAVDPASSQVVRLVGLGARVTDRAA
jgi:hypothetical protein